MVSLARNGKADKCPKCRGRLIQVPTDTVHFARLECGACGRFARWVQRPENIGRTRTKRPREHRELLAKFGTPYCQLCLRTKEQLDQWEVLEAHHVLEYANGGPPTRENTWTLCSKCHCLVHQVRVRVEAKTYA